MSSPLLTNLIGYWKLDGNSNDATSLPPINNGSPNNGTDTDIDYIKAKIDGYSEANVDDYHDLANDNYVSCGQSFHGVTDKLVSCKFHIKKSGSPTGNSVAKLYLETHATAFGTDSVHTGAALATSNTFDVSTLTTTSQLIEFTFSSPYQMSSGVDYVIVIEPTGANWSFAGATGYVKVSKDGSSPTHPGNAERSGVSRSGEDTIFYVYGQTGKINQGAGFNGTTSKIVMPTNSSFNISGDLTISFWSKTTIGDNLFATVVKKHRYEGEHYNYGVFLYNYVSDPTRGYISFYFGDGSGGYANTSGYFNISSPSNFSGNFHLITVVHKSGIGTSFYVDGSLIHLDATNTQSIVSNNDHPLCIGYNPYSTGQDFYSGLIDECALWNRALSASEVSQLYNGNQYPFLSQGNMFLFF